MFFFYKKIRRPFIFIDIGANQGLYTILASKNKYCLKAYAFEPILETANTLNENIKINKCEAKCTVIQKAISDVNTSRVISYNSSHSGAASLDRISDSAVAISVTVINAQELDKILVGIKNEIIVKIDVEGHEEIVLRQLFASNFNQHISAVFYECDEQWIDYKYVQDMLEFQGFKNFIKIGSGTHCDILALRI
ncbi:MAG: FkbM family methyltransferase [Chlorobi bacterium]|nr:FkbM family methyltransferase [Chlorobiota bacterium]